MKTVEEVRRARLSLLRKEVGTLVKLNEKIGLNKRDSTLSQILNSAKNSKTGKGKEMGSPLARRLEAACGKDLGWMDTDPDLERPAVARQTPEIATLAAAFSRLAQHQVDFVMDVIRGALDAAPRVPDPIDPTGQQKEPPGDESSSSGRRAM